MISFPAGRRTGTAVFRSDYQALLSQGIGVFAPNVRGSSGFGKKFVNLDNGALRFDGIKDIKSCVDFLVTSRIADPARIGITGGSYGGYMTMVGLTEYRICSRRASTSSGWSTSSRSSTPQLDGRHLDGRNMAIADAKDLLEKLSPLGKLDRIRAATMVQHGANDTNVPVIEAEQIVAHLKKRNVPVEYILFPDEGHGCGRPRTESRRLWKWCDSSTSTSTALAQAARSREDGVLMRSEGRVHHGGRRDGRELFYRTGGLTSVQVRSTSPLALGDRKRWAWSACGRGTSTTSRSRRRPEVPLHPRRARLATNAPRRVPQLASGTAEDGR